MNYGDSLLFFSCQAELFKLKKPPVESRLTGGPHRVTPCLRTSRCRMLVLVCDACVEIRGPEKTSTTSVVIQGLPTDTGTHTARSDAAVRVPAQPPAEGAPDVGETAAAAAVAAVGATMTTARRGRGAEETGGARGRRDNPAAAQTVCGVPSEAKEAAPHLTCSSCSHRALGCV